MATIQELIQLVAEGDEDAQEQLNQALARLQQDKVAAERDLKLKTDKTLRDRYPRALRAFDRGKLVLTADMDDDQVIQALQAKEDEYAELGVPLEPVVETNPTVEAPAGAVQRQEDPANALSGGTGSSGPGGAPRDLVNEFVELMTKGTTDHDRARANKLLVELQSLPGGKEKVKQISQMLEARPILTQGI
jgi:hypothetical protein